MCQMMAALLLGTMIISNTRLPAAGSETSDETEEEYHRGIEDVASYHNVNLDHLENFITNTIMEDPLNRQEYPIIFVEDEEDKVVQPEAIEKRSRYYRRYPWKRVQSRNRNYENESYRYLCSPTRDDLFQLLVAIHEAREGDGSRQVRFCNRKRPANSIFTNIRFIGKKK